MKAKALCFIVAMTLAIVPLELFARTLGMVADNATKSVTVFDGDTYVVLGMVRIPSGTIGDVLITPNLLRGYVTNFDYKVFVIDLTTSPPSLARGTTNPIVISNAGEDLAISPNGQFLIVTDGSPVEPISVIKLSARAEISTFPASNGANSVDVCRDRDGSVLFTSFNNAGEQAVRRLILSGAGTLTDTGEILHVDDPVNVYCAPGFSGTRLSR